MPRDQRRKQYQVQIFITLFCLFPNKTKFCGSYLTPILFFLVTCSQALEIFFPMVLFLGQFAPQIRYSHIIIIKIYIQVLVYQTKTLGFPNLFLLYFNFFIISILKHFIFTIELILTTNYLKNRVKNIEFCINENTTL